MTGYVLAAEPRQSIDVMNRVVVQVLVTRPRSDARAQIFSGEKMAAKLASGQYVWTTSVNLSYKVKIAQLSTTT